MIGRKDRRETFQDVRKSDFTDPAFPGVEIGDVVRITSRKGEDFVQFTVTGRDEDEIWGSSTVRHEWKPRYTIVQKVIDHAIALPANDYAIIEDERDKGRKLYVQVGGRWVTFRAGVDVDHSTMQLNVSESGFKVVTNGAVTYPDVEEYDSRMNEFERNSKMATEMREAKEAAAQARARKKMIDAMTWQEKYKRGIPIERRRVEENGESK